MRQYTQAIGYLPARRFRGSTTRGRRAIRPYGRRAFIDRPIDRAIRAVRIDRPIDHPIERAGKAIMPQMYPSVSFRGTGALGNPEMSPMTYFWTLAGIASAGASAYHGYKRNNSVGWAIVWGLLGGIAPVITPAVAFAQGFGERKKG